MTTEYRALQMRKGKLAQDLLGRLKHLNYKPVSREHLRPHPIRRRHLILVKCRQHRHLLPICRFLQKKSTYPLRRKQRVKSRLTLMDYKNCNILCMMPTKTKSYLLTQTKYWKNMHRTSQTMISQKRRIRLETGLAMQKNIFPIMQLATIDY